MQRLREIPDVLEEVQKYETLISGPKPSPSFVRHIKRSHFFLIFSPHKNLVGVLLSILSHSGPPYFTFLSGSSLLY